MTKKQIPFTIFDIFILLAGIIVFSMAASYFLNLILSGNLPPTILQALAYLMQILIFLFFLWALNKKYNFKNFKLLGFDKYPLLPAIGYSILAYLTYLVLMIAVVGSAYYYNIELPGTGEQALHIPMFGENLAGLFLLGLIAVVIAPLMEEVVFRGYIQTTFNKYTSGVTAIFLSSILFAGIHFEFQVFIPLFLLGLLLGYLRYYFDNLMVPITFHVMNNLIAFSVEIVWIFYL